MAASGCLLRRFVSSLGTFFKTVLEVPVDVIGCSVRNTYMPHCTKKSSSPLRIFSVNVTKSVGNCGFGHIYLRNP